MASTDRFLQMDFDDLRWERYEKRVEEWEKSLHRAAVYRQIGQLINKYRPGKPVELHKPIKGGFNVFFRLEYEDGSSAGLRIPLPGPDCADEKVRNEVATMRYVAAQTTIPVPEIYHWGTAKENPIGLGPFMVMEYVEHETTMSHALNDPALEPADRHSLDPNINEDKLRLLYGQMANIVLQLSRLPFDRIGSLARGEAGEFSVSGRPLTQNMYSILGLTGAPASQLPPPRETFESAGGWYQAMADMHLVQFAFQHNNAIDGGVDDARDKYVARQLFRNLASQERLSSGFATPPPPPDSSQAHSTIARLFSKDLRPSNVLIDKDLKVVGVIDWEFAYAAPREFAWDPPWWLLLRYPESWPGGYEAWMEAYEPRLETFLSVLEAEEQKLAGVEAARGILSLSEREKLDVGGGWGGEDFVLSKQMWKQWDDQSWMIRYAARESWAFDFLFWRYIDPRYFEADDDNEAADHHARLGCLTAAQREAMEGFV